MSIDSGEASHLPFDRARYPITYRATTTNRWGYVVIAVIMAALGVYLARTIRPEGSADRWVGIVLPIVVAGFAAWLLLFGFRTRLILAPDGLDYRGALLSRRVAAVDIRGWRRPPKGRKGYALELREGRGRNLLISDVLGWDDSSRAWFDRFPDIDQVELEASRARTLEDRSIGATPRDVDEKIAAAIRAARVATCLALALAAWANWLPVHLEVNAALSLALPPLALWACLQWRGLFRLVPAALHKDIRPTLYPVLILASVALLIDLGHLINLRAWQPLIAPAVAAGALAAALALKLESPTDAPSVRISAAAWVMFAATAYAGLAACAANVWLDRAAVRPVRVSVVGTRGILGRPIGAYRMALGPAPTSIDWASVQVSRQDFAFLRVGDVACLSEHAGLVGIAWAELHRCADTPDRPSDTAARHWLAHVARPASQRPPLAQALVDGDWQSVDATLNGLQQRFEAGTATAVDVEQAFIPLYNVEPALDAPLADWLAHAPKSYAAHLAMALHTERQIEWLASAGFDERTSPSLNWEERTRFALAQTQVAMGLSTRPAASLMSQYRLTARRWQSGIDWVGRMVAVDPDDVSMRREYLIQHPICPCNGRAPDDPAMRTLLQADPSRRVRDTLAAYRLFERGADAGNTRYAVDLYQQTLALQPYPQDAYTTHINIAVALVEQHRLDDAIAELKAAIDTLPGNRHAHEELGYVYELQGRKPEALAEFLVDAERGQSWAQMRVGSFMLTPEPGVPLDRKRGAYWMREAANGGQALARDILRRHPDLMIEQPQTW